MPVTDRRLIEALFVARQQTAAETERASNAFDAWSQDPARKAGEEWALDIKLDTADPEAVNTVTKAFTDSGWPATVTAHPITPDVKRQDGTTHELKVTFNIQVPATA